MTNEEIEQRLWEYIDGFSSPEESTVMEKLVRENKQWRDLYQDLLQVHESLGLIELEEPSMRFTKNVMEAIAQQQIAPATKNYINHKIIWGIAAFFTLSIVGFLVYAIGQIDWSAGDATSNQLNRRLENLDYSKVFSSNVMNMFMMLNAVLGLMLLDRFLSRKRKKLYGAI